MNTYIKETTKTRNEAIQAIEISLQQAKFGVLWNFDLSAKLEEKGVQPPAPYTVLEVCKPSIAANVLNESLLAGAFLPCKIVVYEEDEVIKIAMPLPTKLMEGFDNERILTEVKEAEQQLIRCIDQAAD
ncbi:DUF302 domain-containing protein [Sporosarcina sp. BI001-red]|uniref:DUF302 domain-containing protein n=1 Tax=Sporosarcina sp. BI001-red TaxID=2282866 RepID=UPI000E26F82C|nr:DUF302 domain-containing protein [Sporosarcina sp. BI001-red]REB08657.1 DUF302 domain-containing protein [Sporosarcina sp. BI001-red]